VSKELMDISFIADRDLWDRFVSSYGGNFLQSWEWGEVKRRHGWFPLRLALIKDNTPVLAAQVLFRKLFGLTVAYVPRGPVGKAEGDDLDKFIYGLHKVARANHAIFLRIEPPREVPWARLLEGAVINENTIQPRATLTVDLSVGEEAILKSMRSKTRYYVRQSEKLGVTTREGSLEDVKVFYDLLEETSSRARFGIHAYDYYKDVYQQFVGKDLGKLILAEWQGEVIAGVFTIAFGNYGVYLYAASKTDHRDKYPNYLLQWKAMQWCAMKGCKTYDLWGVPLKAAREFKNPTSGSPDISGQNEGLWGVYGFKRHFGREAVIYPPALDYPYIRPLYLAWFRLRGAESE